MEKDETEESPEELAELQRQRLLDDCEKYGDYQKGEYKGYQWYTRRARRNSLFGYWCGYIKVDATIYSGDIDGYNESEPWNCLHGGPTCNNGDWIGFDCAHYDDYPLYARGTFRDFP
jgi:hypothetical protein